MEFTVREAQDIDAAQLIELIGACFAEYPGCILDVDREEPALRAIRTSYAARDGNFWVAEEGGKVVGCVGVAPTVAAGGVALHKLYVARSARRQGLGTRLCELVFDAARSRGAKFVELWSDTRFLDAHRLYEGMGFVRGRQTRHLRDFSDTEEFYYRLEL